jgi:hypothetical protein
MTITALTSAPSNSFWSRAWRFLSALDEAIHTTEAGLLAARVEHLERQIEALKNASANRPAEQGR